RRAAIAAPVRRGSPAHRASNPDRGGSMRHGMRRAAAKHGPEQLSPRRNAVLPYAPRVSGSSFPPPPRIQTMTSTPPKNIAGLPVTTLAERHGTPLFVYDREVIERRVSELREFDVIRYAQKASSNLALLALMRKLGVVVDAVSAGEVERALRAGFRPEGTEGTAPDGDVPGIVFTADLFDADAVEAIRAHKLPVNVGSPDMITQLGSFFPGAHVTLRL